jgi:arsenite methyltransferase
LVTAGFETVELEPTRKYRVEGTSSSSEDSELDVEAIGSQIDGRFMSTFIRAKKLDGSRQAKDVDQ